MLFTIVRGELGPITIWTTDQTFINKNESRDQWTLLYNKVQPESFTELRTLQLDIPVRLKPGDSCGLYVHSSTPGDSQIVYDNQRTDITHRDDFLEILPGWLCPWHFVWFETKFFIYIESRIHFLEVDCIVETRILLGILQYCCDLG